AHRSESDAASGGTSEADVAIEASGDAGEKPSHPPDTTVRTRKEGGRRYSPVVMRMAAEHGIDLEQIEGTGRGGRVRKQDVLAFMEDGGGAATEPPMHIESPYRPDEPAAPRKPKSRLGPARPPAEPAPAA